MKFTKQSSTVGVSWLPMWKKSWKTHLYLNGVIDIAKIWNNFLISWQLIFHFCIKIHHLFNVLGFYSVSPGLILSTYVLNEPLLQSNSVALSFPVFLKIPSIFTFKNFSLAVKTPDIFSFNRALASPTSSHIYLWLPVLSQTHFFLCFPQSSGNILLLMQS